MSELIIPLREASGENSLDVGNKAAALASIIEEGIFVPDGICLTRYAYDLFVQETGVSDLIMVELGRKEFEEMRWEEMWDASLRIRNMFTTAEMPEMLRLEIEREVISRFEGRPVAVRSSSLAEDSAGASFAGLHESLVNVAGSEKIIQAIKLVWASLWSDAALLYRNELDLDMRTSAMAVIIQEMVFGEVSGVGFCVDPNDPGRGVIEAVHGLNKGLVDGDVEPDRHFLDRATGKVVSCSAASRVRKVEPAGSGVRIVDMDSADGMTIDEGRASEIFSLMLRLEEIFGSPQDVEWTVRDGEIFILQSRPITTGDQGEKGWYLSLRRSLDSLERLGKRIEDEILPGMEAEAAELDSIDLDGLSDEQLATEVERRKEAYDRWKDVYWNECIPFAHGVRLFGTVYNDAVNPEDPYEFVDVIRPENMKSLERNSSMLEAAEYLRDHPGSVDTRSDIVDERFVGQIDAIIRDMGSVLSGEDLQENRRLVVGLLRGIAGSGHHGRDEAARKERYDSFISAFPPDEREEAEKLVSIAKKSYRLRDDDNIYLDRIESVLMAAVSLACTRIGERCAVKESRIDPSEIARALRSSAYVPKAAPAPKREDEAGVLNMRQMRGQPAGKGIARGIARVIGSSADLFAVEKGEILVCDSIDPSMTFVVPLVAGIVERRGGMLIHGAIIAREYGIACVTGIPDATRSIRTGDDLTVDGYRGIVIDHSRTLGRS